MEQETNRRVNKIKRWMKLAGDRLVHCGICPPNKVENAKRHARRSWKKDKKRHQHQ